MRAIRGRVAAAAVVAAAVCAAAVVALVLALAGGGGGGAQRAQATRPAASPSDDAAGGLRAHPQAVEPSVGAPVVAQIDVPPESPRSVPHDPEEALAAAPKGTAAAGPSPGAPSDAEIRTELRAIQGAPGGRARLLPDGTVIPPANAPAVVKSMMAAGNAIARLPYVWGGGHARVFDTGYDCSGSMSFAFIQAGLLQAPIAEGWSTMGQPGPGRWVSVYSDAGHVWAIIAGLRFDTSALHIAGSRWTDQMRSTAGFTVRHLPGL
jgi:cell wall-associated NlpC family hydrolase